jgi:hypothetical protein
MNHTPTPWEHDGNGNVIGVEDGEHVLIATATRNEDDALTEYDTANIPRIVACVNACAGVTNDALAMMPLKELHDSRTQLCRDLRNTRMLLDAALADKAALFKALSDTDEWLREIRAENLDGSERGVGVRLEQNIELFERYHQKQPLPDLAQATLPIQL